MNSCNLPLKLLMQTETQSHATALHEHHSTYVSLFPVHRHGILHGSASPTCWTDAPRRPPHFDPQSHPHNLRGTGTRHYSACWAFQSQPVSGNIWQSAEWQVNSMMSRKNLIFFLPIDWSYPPSWPKHASSVAIQTQFHPSMRKRIRKQNGEHKITMLIHI